GRFPVGRAGVRLRARPLSRFRRHRSQRGQPAAVRGHQFDRRGWLERSRVHRNPRRVVRAGAVALLFGAACGGTTPAGAIRFEDVPAQAGLTGARSAGNTHGVGILFADLDGDGWADIYVVNGHNNVNGLTLPSALYHNNGNGTFTDVTAHAR